MTRRFSYHRTAYEWATLWGIRDTRALYAFLDWAVQQGRAGSYVENVASPTKGVTRFWLFPAHEEALEREAKAADARDRLAEPGGTT